MSKKSGPGDTLTSATRGAPATDRSSSESLASTPQASGPPASGAPPKASRGASKSRKAKAAAASRPVRRTPTPPVAVNGVGRARRSGEQTLFGQELVARALAPSGRPANESTLDMLPADTCAEHEAPLRPSEALRAAARAQASGGAAGPVSEDEVSIPPASPDFDEHEHFFAEGELADQAARDYARALGRGGLRRGARDLDHASLADAAAFYQEKPDARLMQLASPATRARRARFQRYVKAAVGVSAVVCIAALVRVNFARANHESASLVAAAQLEPVAIAASAANAPPRVGQVGPSGQAGTARDIPPVPQEVPETVIAETVVTGGTGLDTTAAETAAPAAALPEKAAPEKAAPEKPVPEEAAPEKTAAQEKHDARSLLERYRPKDAIAAGERSVALDATDGEAWLVLGAAYQEVGQLADARRAFLACVKQGRRGPIGECRALLQ